ncbi:hypothetical protein R1sor_024955 [Riccia sorocarpa]|uniref:NB-ARC domain-containing protein n=1 Tax=Riccia sorocarpa TaxID=122646 RepID=A0ABD3G9Y9_9MARC
MLTPFKYYFIPEGSSRYGEDFDIVPKDHVYTCRPRDRSDRTYVHLKELIERVLRQVEEENILRRGEQLNDYVYELYKPMDGPAEVDVLFFHGLNLNPTASNDIHVSTWTSGEGREAHLWPKTWLSQDFPRARILAISYDSHLITTAEQGRTDLHNAAESLMTCLLLEREASLLRPLVLVGHCFGGVLIKQLCVHAHDRQGEGAQMETELRCFLKKIKVILFLGTPHHGMTLPGLQEAARGESSPLVKDVEVFNAGAARLHERFDRLTREYKWRIAGVGELNETKWGESHCVMVPEASARYGEFTSVQADHISLSKPRGKHSHVYIRLTMLIEQPSSRHHTPGNNQTVPPIASELVAFEVVQAHRTLKSFTCLGFYGMGGVGKSTLARLVFNRLNQEFEYSCFISDVKLKTGISLEEVLANAMHHYGERMNYNEFTWGHLSGRRVLIVLDDVTKYEHLQILGNIASQVSSKEHRYIVTCRDVALLGTLRSILHPREVELYSVPLLGEASARKLLLSYGVPDPPAQEFVERVVTLCNGLPLSLEVIGKYLHENKGKEKIWEKSVDALHNCVNIHNFKERLWDILQFSYDHLADEAKEMFLDCASFFAGSSWRLHEAKVAWQSLFPNYADDFWESLVNMSLVYDVKDDDSIQMHEQMKDLGTKLAMFSGDGGKCSRTWNAKLLSKALGIASTEHWSGGRNPSSKRPSSGRPSRKQQISVSRRLPEGIKAVIALRLEEPMPITMEDISNMTGLRYLDSSKVLAPISGRRIPSGVVLLRWRGEFASIADVFDPEQMNELAVFHLEAPSLHKVPDSFGLLSELQILTFTGCKFSTLPQSFGELLGLQHLEFTNCTELCSLPESFGRLLDLEFFSFSVADVYGEKSSESGEQNFLPASFGDLKNLKNLILCGCRNLHSLPESFSKLKSLEELRIERCNNLLTLSQSFGELPELHTLDVCHCRNLRKVPASFGRLSKLRTVCISDCESFRAFPETLGDLVSLESLVISDCKRLHQLPGTLGQLSKLQKLEICGTEVDELPTTMSNLYNLQRLEIVKNEKLKSLPNFWDLSLQQHSGNKRSLLQLRHLLITECDQLDVLHTSLGHLPALRRLEISRCRRVPALPDSVEHLSQLEHLELIECEQICSLPDNFGNLTSLETLDISLCSISSLPDSFSNLRNLTKLSLLKCPLTDLPKEFGNLTRLILRDCNVSILPGSLSSLGNLKELEISNCPYLTNLPGSFGTITSLTKLTLSNCGVSILPDSFSKLVKLDELVILSCRLNGLPVDFQKLVALRLLTLIEVPWTSVPTCIKFLPSLHTLTVKLPDLTEECEWLGQGLSRVRSYNRFCKRNGGFCLMEEES